MIRPLPRDPITDADLAEERAHEATRRIGLTSREDLWLATLIARCSVRINEGRPEHRTLRVLRDEMERRILAHRMATRPGDPNFGWWDERFVELDEARCIPPETLAPPDGWLMETT